jgi:hypothetical protein
MKSVTPTFNCVIGRGLAFGSLMILSNFRFDEGLLLSLVLQELYAPLHHMAVCGNTPH